MIEGDSKNIIELIKGEHSPSWSIEVFIKDIKRVIWDKGISFIAYMYREENKLANRLVNEGLCRTTKSQWEDSIPPLQSTWSNDLPQGSNGDP